MQGEIVNFVHTHTYVLDMHIYFECFDECIPKFLF